MIHATGIELRLRPETGYGPYGSTPAKVEVAWELIAVWATRNCLVPQITINGPQEVVFT